MRDPANDIRSLSDSRRHTVELLDRVDTIEGIQRGLADVKAGRTRPAKQVFDRLRRRHRIPR
jgi:hypothetical protein